MERSEWSDLVDLRKVLEEFLFSQLYPPLNCLEEKGKKCAMCLRGEDAARLVVGLSEGFCDQVIRVFLSALLLPNGDDLLGSLGSGRILRLCGECTESLSTLTDLFLQLEELRKQFNDLRRRVGREVIVTSLGIGEDAYGKWEEEVRKVEDLYPSCAVKMKVSPSILVDEEVKGESEEEEVKEEWEEVDDDFDYLLEESDDHHSARWEDDDKLKQRTSVVLHRLPTERQMETPRSPSPETQVVFSRSPEVEEIVEVSNNAVVTSDLEGNNNTRGKKRKIAAEEVKDYRAKMKKPEPSTLTFPCPQPRCSSIFMAADHVARHVEIFHPTKKPQTPRPFPCAQCDATFLHAAVLKSHVRKTHQPNNCPSCHASFPNSKKLSLHRKSVHGYVAPLRTPPTRVCDVCDRKFGEVEHRLRHQFKDHGASFKELQCSHCDMTFLHPPALKTHIIWRHWLGSKDEGHLQCPLCLQFFQNDWNLHHHQKRCHPGSQESPKEGQQPQEAQQDPDEGQQVSKEGQPPPAEGQSPDPNVLNIHCFVCKDSRRYSSAEELAEHAATSEHLETLRSKVSVYCNVCKVNFKGSTEALKVHLTSPEHLKEAEFLKDVDLSTFCVPCRKPLNRQRPLGEHLKSYGHVKASAFRLNEKVTEVPAELEVPAQCPSCLKTFQFQSKLDKHIRRFHNPSGYSCQFCPDKFAHFSDLTRHRAATHSDQIPKPHMCEKCGRTFDTQAHLGSHLRSNHRNGPRPKPYVCDSCGKAFIMRHYLSEHTLKCTNAPDSSPCPHCTASFKTPHRLRQHVYRVHYAQFLEEKPHSCPVPFCWLVYPTSADLTSHMTSHGYLGCDTCGKRFLFKAEGLKHQRSHTKEKPFECSICSARFSLQKTYKNHMDRHAEGTKATIRKARPSRAKGTRTKTPSTRKRKERAGKLTQPESLACSSCDQKFRHRSTLEKHSLVCSAAPSSVNCGHCTAAFKTPQRLRQHMHRSHYSEFLSETPHSCPICYVVLPSTEELTSHMTSAHGNLTCDTCGKQFLHTAILNVHRRIHTGEQPFACTLCPKKFNLNSNLKEHMIRHTGEKPHGCSKCDESFWRKNHLEKHVRETHN